jgi:hypothetical protein
MGCLQRINRSRKPGPHAGAVAVFADRDRRLENIRTEALNDFVAPVFVVEIETTAVFSFPENRHQIALLDQVLVRGRRIGAANPADGILLIGHDGPPKLRRRFVL